jgi:hypothetical protein
MSTLVKRRDFIAVLGGAAAWPLAARAQQGERMQRIGVLQTALSNTAESLATKPVGEPDALIGHVRFDESPRRK